MQHGLPLSESLVAALGSYMLSASAMVGEYCNVLFKELKLAVLYWERRSIMLLQNYLGQIRTVL